MQRYEKYKDSGVDWIGEIPQKWEILSITKFSTRIDYRGKTPEKVESGTFLITTRNIKNGSINYEISKEYVSDKNYIIFHTLFGRRVNDALSRALAFIVASARRRDVEVGINDNGFFIAGKELDLNKVEKGFRMLRKEDLRKVLEEAIDKSEILKRRFRHCASRGLMILRNYKGKTKSVGRQQMSSHFMLAAVSKKSKDFPILKEAKREVLEDLMDIKNTEWVLERINKNEIKIEKKNTKVMSPFAINIILSSHSDVIRVEDKIEFIKRVYAELKKN